jgi:hypothetical protein
MNIYKLLDADGNVSVVIANDENSAIKVHCSIFPTHKDDVSIRHIGNAVPKITETQLVLSN